MTVKRKHDKGTISIAGRDYAYRLVDDLESDAGVGLNGWYKGDTREIEVRTGLPSDQHKDVLVHEIVHGILRQTGHEPADRNDCENLVEALTHGLVSVRINGRPLIR